MLTRFMLKPERIRSFLANPDDIHFFSHIFLFRQQSISEFNSLLLFFFGVFFSKNGGISRTGAVKIPL